MKIRNGFVSNSSSSSFVVAFPREPKSVEDVKEMVFGEKERFENPYADLQWRPNSTESWSADEVAKTIWEDIKEQKVNDIKAITESVSNGWFDDFDDLPGHDSDEKWKKVRELNWNDPEDNKKIQAIWDESEKENEKRAKKISKRFREVVGKEAQIYVFEFSDNDGEYFCALEHGEVFRNLPNIRTSYH